MEITVKENGILNLTIEKNGEEFETLKKNILAKYKDRKVDGFRPGKVPFDVLETTFKKDLESEMVEQVINEEYSKALKEEKFVPISNLVLDETKIEKNSIILKLTVATEPEFEMPEYKGLNVNLEEVNVTDDEVTKQIDLMVSNAKKKIELSGDIVAELEHEVDINFEGFVEGVAFEGGKAENYSLVLGSKSFIDTFEDQIVGHKIGEEFDVNVTFPEEYHAENLKGKPALFKVKLNKISKFEKPELNDEFAKSNGAESLDDLRIKVKENMLLHKESEAKNKKLNTIITTLKDNTNLEVADILIEEEVSMELRNMNAQLQQSGLTFQQYLDILGKTIEEMKEEMKPRAKENVKARLVLTKLAKVEKFTVEKEDMDKEFEFFASQYNMTKEQIIEDLTKNGHIREFEQQVVNKVMNDKIMNFLLENN